MLAHIKQNFQAKIDEMSDLFQLLRVLLEYKTDLIQNIFAEQNFKLNINLADEDFSIQDMLARHEEKMQQREDKMETALEKLNGRLDTISQDLKKEIKLI